MISISGLTAQQRKICDKIWSIDSQEEIEAWLDGLAPRRRREDQVMIEMITLAVLDHETTEPMTEACAVIDRIRSL
jgi:hypothetical protein